MALFGKSKNEEKNLQAQSAKDQPLDIADAKAAEKPAAKPAVKSKEDTGDAYRILLKPIVTEKSYRAVAEGRYVFKVNPKANKISIRKAVEKVYDVKVARVNIVSMRGKAKISGKARGRSADWKKAVVTLKPGETITQA